jgi:hypothetical protein
MKSLQFWASFIKKLFLFLSFILSRLRTGASEQFLTNIYKFSSYLTGNTLRLRYKDQPVNAVWRNSRCLLWETYGTQIIYKDSIRTSQETHYVTAVWGNNRCLLWEPYGTHTYTQGRLQSFSMLQQVVHILVILVISLNGSSAITRSRAEEKSWLLLLLLFFFLFLYN